LIEDSRTTDFGLGWFRVGLTKDLRTIEFQTTSVDGTPFNHWARDNYEHI